jgi:hypothetical protein
VLEADSSLRDSLSTTPGRRAAKWEYNFNIPCRGNRWGGGGSQLHATAALHVRKDPPVPIVAGWAP